MINITYGLINDYLNCPKKVFYRLYEPEEAVTKSGVVIGKIVHSILENYWEDERKAYLSISKYMKDYNCNNGDEIITTCIYNFFNKISPICNKDDLIEHKFKVTWANQRIIGSYDRVNSVGFIDWKVCSRRDDTIVKTQVALYSYAYNVLYSKEPKYAKIVSLYEGEIIEMKPDIEFTKLLKSTTIPAIVNDVSRKHFPKLGERDGLCITCPYSNVCLEENENLVYTRTNKE